MSPSKKDRFKNLIEDKDEPRESQSKKDIISDSINISTNASNNVSIENDPLTKIEVYKQKVKEKSKQKTHDDMYAQQNVYIDRNLIAAIKDILKKNKKLTKQEIYNEALKMYLDIVHDVQIRLKSEE